MTVENAIKVLQEKKNARIELVKQDTYIVRNDGQWGLIEDGDFVVDGESLIEMVEMYCK